MAGKAKGSLPDGFPGKAALEDAGVTTYAGVRKLVDGGILTGVAGIGDGTAARITDALATADAAAESGDEQTDQTEQSEPAAAAGNTNSDAPSPETTEATDVERPAGAVKVVCPKCGVGGEVASDEQVGVAECGSDKHPGTKLVRA